VESIKPVAMQAMFSKIGLAEVSQAFQHLATLRPTIIIPQIVERFVTLASTIEQQTVFSWSQFEPYLMLSGCTVPWRW